MRRNFLISFIILLSSVSRADRPFIDYSAQLARFEQKVIERIQLALDPQLGRSNYTLVIKTKVKSVEEEGEPIYFSKLGMKATLPNALSSNGIKFENWVDNIDVGLAYSVKINMIDAPKIKSKIEEVLSSLGKFKYKIDIDTFTVSESLQPTPKPYLVPGALVALAAIIFLALFFVARVLQKMSLTSSGASSGSSESMGITERAVSATGGVSVNSKFDGIKRWTQWINDDQVSAKTYVEKLLRSPERSDRALLAYVFQNNELKSTKSLINGLKGEAIEKLKEIASMHLELEETQVLDQRLLSSVTQNFVEQQLDDDKVLKIIHDFTVDECIYVCEQDPQMIGLFINGYTTPHVEQILARVSTDKIEKFLKTKSDQETNWVTFASRAKDKILELRQKTDDSTDDKMRKWVTIASHLEFSREQAFYENIFASKSTPLIQNYVIENFPQFLALELPEQLLKTVLNSYPFESRAGLLFSYSENIRLKLMAVYANEPKVKEILETEFDSIKIDFNKSRTIQNKQMHLQKEFNQKIRKYIQSSFDHRESAKVIFENWLKIPGKVANAGRKNAI